MAAMHISYADCQHAFFFFDHATQKGIMTRLENRKTRDGTSLDSLEKRLPTQVFFMLQRLPYSSSCIMPLFGRN